MSLLILLPGRDHQPLEERLRELAPEIPLQVWPNIVDADAIKMALCWQYPSGALTSFPNLRLVSSYGAGVDHFLKDPQFPSAVAVSRIVDPYLADDMRQFCVATILAHRCRLSDYQKQQHQKIWRPLNVQPVSSVGILGLGVLAKHLAEALLALGFKVSAWSRGSKQEANIHTCCGPGGLQQMAAEVDVLVNLLPLTDATRGILNKNLFARMKVDSFLVNVARGGHLVEEDLLDALALSKPGWAALDVFESEPLAAEHPFWKHERIQITPHSAALTRMESVAIQVTENYRRLVEGLAPQHAVDIQRGY